MIAGRPLRARNTMSPTAIRWLGIFQITLASSILLELVPQVAHAPRQLQLVLDPIGMILCLAAMVFLALSLWAGRSRI